MAARIAVLDDYQGVARSYGPWHDLPPDTEVVVFTEPIEDVDELVRALEPFDVVAAMRGRTRFGRDVLERLPNLRLLVTTGMRNASIDVGAASELGVTVCGTASGSPADELAPTAELTWGLILAVTRNIVREDRNVRDGGWQDTVGIELSGRRLGVVGLGRLGRQVAGVGKVLGMDTVAWSQNLTEEQADPTGVRAVGKRELFETSDVVTIHVQLSSRTRGLVGAADLERMHPGAYLVNTSRGPVVDEAALRSALHEGRIAGAGLDVFDREPLPVDDPWRTTPRTVLTPHIGYVTRRTYETFYTETVEDIIAYLAGSPTRVLNA